MEIKEWIFNCLKLTNGHTLLHVLYYQGLIWNYTISCCWCYPGFDDWNCFQDYQNLAMLKLYVNQFGILIESVSEFYVINKQNEASLLIKLPLM